MCLSAPGDNLRPRPLAAEGTEGGKVRGRKEGGGAKRDEGRERMKSKLSV